MRNLAIAIALAVGATFALSPANSAEPLKSDGKCWASNPKTNGMYNWGACPKEKVAKKEHKGHKTAKAEHKPETKKKA
jgi:hypothetical protein